MTMCVTGVTGYVVKAARTASANIKYVMTYILHVKTKYLQRKGGFRCPQTVNN